MFQTEFRRSTILWLLVAAFGLGLGAHIIKIVCGRSLRYPLTIVENDAEARALKRKADSIMAQRMAAVEGPLNINTASAADFESLDGIGKVLAARIVAYRTEHGPFKSVNELDNVSGIGPKRLSAMRGRCFTDSSSLSDHSAD
jgi:competence ComEA-like helix-hairpin-helix protein